MEPIQYDPRTKQQIKEELKNILYQSAKREFNQRLEALIIKNCLLTGYSHRSFTHKGEFYSIDRLPPPRKQNRLVPELVPVMDAYLMEQAKINIEELPYTLGYINRVLNASNSLLDYKRLLPAALHRPLDAFAFQCPCKTPWLKEEVVQEIQKSNELPINLIKQRMVKNLLT